MTDRDILKLYDDGGPGGLLSHEYIVCIDDVATGGRRAGLHTNTVDDARQHAEQYYLKLNPKIWQRPKRGKTWTERVLT